MIPCLSVRNTTCRFRWAGRSGSRFRALRARVQQSRRVHRNQAAHAVVPGSRADAVYRVDGATGRGRADAQERAPGFPVAGHRGFATVVQILSAPARPEASPKRRSPPKPF